MTDEPPVIGDRPKAPRGRGASSNPVGRFERLQIDSEVPGPERLTTHFLRDTTRQIIAKNASPDVPFDASVNPYRGCEHGCIYCYARTTHEYLGFSAGLDFETRIMVKEDAPELLRKELASPRWKPQVLGISGVTDPYQPVERKLELTRGCLEVLAECRNPVAIVTKNALVTRDIDYLQELAKWDAVLVFLSITTLDGRLMRTLEPRTSHPRDRLRALEKLSAAGVPCGVLVAPILPGLTDHEIPSILEAAAEAGAGWCGYTMLRLPGAVAPLFENWLEENYPDRKTRVLNRVREVHGGVLAHNRFGTRMRGHGTFAEGIKSLFHSTARRLNLEEGGRRALAAKAFRPPLGPQRSLFDE